MDVNCKYFLLWFYNLISYIDLCNFSGPSISISLLVCVLLADEGDGLGSELYGSLNYLVLQDIFFGGEMIWSYLISYFLQQQ